MPKKLKDKQKVLLNEGLANKAKRVMAMMEDYENMLNEWAFCKGLLKVLVSPDSTEEVTAEAKEQARQYLAIA